MRTRRCGVFAEVRSNKESFERQQSAGVRIDNAGKLVAEGLTVSSEQSSS